ncbi:MAG: hypothetical protein ACR2PU_03215 [Gammaproteobacteria bacterium]
MIFDNGEVCWSFYSDSYCEGIIAADSSLRIIPMIVGEHAPLLVTKASFSPNPSFMNTISTEHVLLKKVVVLPVMYA